jgi:hypothetical protein
VGRVGETPPPKILRPFLAQPPGNNQASPGLITPARQEQLQEALRTLAEAGNYPAAIVPRLFALAPAVLPGKRLSRFDRLHAELGKTFLLARINTLDGEYAVARLEVTALFQPGPNRPKLAGEPDFIASLRAIETGKAVFVRQDALLFIARPLLCKGEVLGSLVMSNRTAAGVSRVTREDRAVFAELAGAVSKLSGNI